MSRIQKTDINAKQAKFLKSRAKRKSFIGGRGSGKSTVMGLQVGSMWQEFPRATWVAAGLTYVQLDSIVVPAIREGLELLGFYEYDPKHQPYGVYVVQSQPPKHWRTPYKKPGKKIYQYCITFINGFTIRLVSQDNKETHRGLSIDGILVDESATISFDFIEKILIPALRGRKDAPYYNHPLHHGFFDFSSASWTIEGNWIYDTEEKYKNMLKLRKEKYESLEAEGVGKGKKWLAENPPEYLYMESTYQDNQHFLPDDYGDRLRDAMDPWKYNVEVLNQRVVKLPNAYYHGFNASLNLYSKTYDYHTDQTGKLKWSSNDYHADRQLEVSLDFNADICWLLVCQEYAKEFRVINSEFKKPTVVSTEQEQSLLQQLGSWFITEYMDHGKKEVLVYGDPNGNKRSASTSKSNLVFFDEFVKILKDNGWKVFRRESKSYPNPQKRYSLVNLMLSGINENAPKVKINQTTNKSFIIALQNTLVKTDKSYSKDKKSESKARMREYATDPTDAFDYILYAKFGHLIGKTRWSNSGVITIRK
ncbi:hypothetical protein LAG90_15630 [Marinilongibacter aquaticus]|uniref:hypothetical protein n=1 Tax=Marinilongibacter aquaticus TaxID=2975157 RepID=UPI0021BD7516|nr:hypothetical protein [Marinilongibacter aquaticus]UBM58234.1 hypothetical protein LAG90_15630 [Marinilongibacter aquaticus]